VLSFLENQTFWRRDAASSSYTWGKRSTMNFTPHTNTRIHIKHKQIFTEEYRNVICPICRPCILSQKCVYCCFSWNGYITNTTMTYSWKFNPFIKCIKLNFIKMPRTVFDLTALWVNRSSVFICTQKKANHGKISQRLLQFRMFLQIKIK
jgi:hypothetical protein